MANLVNVSVGGQSIPVKITGSNGSVHISPGSTVVIGKSPYINPDTGTWMVYDDKTRSYVDSGVSAESKFHDVSDEFIIDENDVLNIYEISAEKIEGLADMLRNIMVPATTSSIGGIIVGDDLLVTEEGRLSVDKATSVDEDNTKPITAAAVYTEVGNINALLATI